MLDVEEIINSARGRWLSIFSQLGINVPEPSGKHGPCPMCRGGEDRFRLDKDTSDGKWFCNQCTPQSGNGVSLVWKVLGLPFPEILKKINEILGNSEIIEDNQPKQTEYDRRLALNKLWKSSQKLFGSDPVSKYLHQRGLVLTPEYVRFCPECYESETKSNMPAMVAMFLDPEGKPLTIHRTYLNGTGKAKIKSPKKIMPGTANLVGGAIRLFKPVDDTIGIAEGIETAIAATQIASIPCWAALSSTMLKGFIPPEGIKKIVIFADNDSNFTGQAAAYHLANRLHIDSLVAEVLMPEIGNDFNDYLLKMKGN